MTVGFVLFASGKHAWAGDYDLAAAELAAGGAEAVGNIAGFGAGDAAREIARQGLIAADGWYVPLQMAADQWLPVGLSVALPLERQLHLGCSHSVSSLSFLSKMRQERRG